jgi:peroxiredoxin
MKTLLLVLIRYGGCIALLLSSLLSWSQSSKDLKLPLQLVTGYGPFPVDKTAITFSAPPVAHPLSKAWSSLRFDGVPTTLKAVEKGVIWLDFLQFLYQHTQAGNLPLAFYTAFRQERQIATAEENLSKRPLACYVLLVKGIDESGKEVLLLDTDNDSNFADESPMVAAPYQSDQDFAKLVDKSVLVRYQTVFHQQVVARTIPLLVLKRQDRYLYSFPQYARATLTQPSGPSHLAVSHEFHFPNYQVANVTRFSSKPAAQDSIACKNQYFTVGGRTYQNKGVDLGTLSLVLEEITAPVASLQGAQKGLQALAFTGQDVVTGQPISLADFKGKYVFLDFWGSWCSPCLGQLSKLREIYARVKKEQVAFVGIAGRDDRERLRKTIAEQQLSWPTIFSDQANRIVENYNIQIYPTGLLLDPTGKVEETDVSSLNLERLLQNHLTQ